MTKSLTSIQEHLLRFRYIDNSLFFLMSVCIQSNSEYANTVFFKYATIDLITFLDHHRGFVGLIKGNQKTLVLAMSPFLKEIFKNHKEIQDIRSKWTAHILKGGQFQKELSKKHKDYSFQDLIIMINGLREFTLGLQMIFPEDTNYLIDNFTKKEEDIRKPHTISNETIGLIINDKIKTVNGIFKINGLAFQFDEKIFDIHVDK